MGRLRGRWRRRQQKGEEGLTSVLDRDRGVVLHMGERAECWLLLRMAPGSRGDKRDLSARGSERESENHECEGREWDKSRNLGEKTEKTVRGWGFGLCAGRKKGERCGRRGKGQANKWPSNK
jgi:hypothetical protein